nr:MAG TPA: hypothetical protein [Caudoviricetes sp.]
MLGGKCFFLYGCHCESGVYVPFRFLLTKVKIQGLNLRPKIIAGGIGL